MRKQIELALVKLDIDTCLLEEGRPGFGDWALPCFMLTKQFKAQPQAIAANLAEKIHIKGVTTKALGPYLNFFVDWPSVGQKMLGCINERYGRLPKISKIAVIDFSSPNPAHPFHMGTTRSTIMGEALSRILESQGWSVKRFCYINDMGRQAAALMLGYQMNFSGLGPDKKPDVWLGDIYFKINQSIEEDPTLEEKLEEMLRAYETGDKDIRSLGKRIFGWCLNGFRENWRLLGIKFDKIMWESEFISESREIVESIKRAGLTSMSDGALVLKLEDHGLPNTILLRTGGTGLYLTRDIACTMWKFKNYKPDLNVWVVAEDQKLHFQQQLKTLELLGQTDIAAKSVHLAYSMVLLEGRKMSARKGWMVLWDELLDEGTKRAAEEVEKRWPELSPAEKQRRARSIALAAIVYFMLKYAPEKIVNFSWDAALAFEGDTGPYLQYTYARAASILRKAKVKRVGKFDSKLLKDPKEIALLKLLAQYPTTLSKSARDLRPHYLAGYLFNLADAFNQFYQALPVIRADKPLRSARLKLVEATKTVLKNGLELLAIAAPEKM